MFRTLDSVEELGRQNTVFMLQSLREWNRGLQELGTETLGFGYRSIEEGAKAAEAMLAAPSIDEAIEIQNGFVKRAYQDWVAVLGKLGGTLMSVSKDAYKPLNIALNGFTGNGPMSRRDDHTRREEQTQH